MSPFGESYVSSKFLLQSKTTVVSTLRGLRTHNDLLTSAIFRWIGVLYPNDHDRSTVSVYFFFRLIHQHWKSHFKFQRWGVTNSEYSWLMTKKLALSLTLIFTVHYYCVTKLSVIGSTTKQVPWFFVVGIPRFSSQSKKWRCTSSDDLW
jgi:hypothetical protein